MTFFICLTDCIEDDESRVPSEHKEMLDCYITIKNNRLCRILDYLGGLVERVGKRKLMPSNFKPDDFTDHSNADRSWALRMMMDGIICTTVCPKRRVYDLSEKLLAEAICRKN